MTDETNHNVKGFPLSSRASVAASVTLGSNTGCNASSFSEPPAVLADADVFAIALHDQHRVALYHQPPSTDLVPADIFPGQPDATSCASPASPSASSLNEPSGVWSDGQRTVVADYGNGRLLIWLTPVAHMSHGQAAEPVLGANDFATVGGQNCGPSSYKPDRVFSNGK